MKEKDIEKKEMNVTSVSELKKYAKGSIVELPPFADGQPFVARMKRPSMLKLIKEGTIPNTLLVKANELFANTQQAFDPDNEDTMQEVFDIIDIIAEASFVEPTYSEIKDSGIDLTDDQLMFIFNYSQRGVKALESFRNEQED